MCGAALWRGCGCVSVVGGCVGCVLVCLVCDCGCDEVAAVCDERFGLLACCLQALVAVCVVSSGSIPAFLSAAVSRPIS